MTCTGKLSIKDHRRLKIEPIGTVIQVTCPKCHGSADAYVTPLGDAQIRSHFPPAVLKRSAAIKAEFAAEDDDEDEDDRGLQDFRLRVPAT